MTECVLILYVAELSQRVCHATARAYLAAIRHMHLSAGLLDPVAGAERLGLVLWVFRHRKPRGTDSRLPITSMILRRIGCSLKLHADQYEQLMIWAACCLGFFAFMRSGELTNTDNTAFDPALHLSPMDIVVDDTSNPSMLKSQVKVLRDAYEAGYQHLLGKDI